MNFHIPMSPCVVLLKKHDIDTSGGPQNTHHLDIKRTRAKTDRGWADILWRREWRTGRMERKEYLCLCEPVGGHQHTHHTHTCHLPACPTHLHPCTHLPTHTHHTHTPPHTPPTICPFCLPHAHACLPALPTPPTHLCCLPHTLLFLVVYYQYCTFWTMTKHWLESGRKGKEGKEEGWPLTATACLPTYLLLA